MTCITAIGRSLQRRLHRNVTRHIGIERQDAKGAGIALRLHQTGFKRKGHDAGQHIAAIGCGVDRVFVRLQLGKQEIDVHARLGALAHNRDFTGERMRAA